MAIDFKTPEQVAEEYLTHLKLTKPDVNTNQTDNDWWIKSRTLGGFASGLYSDQRKVSNDGFPQDARHEALGRHLITYFNRDFNPATKARGPVKVTGTIGSTIPALTELLYEPNGNTYQVTGDVILSGTSGEVGVESVSSGQGQNLTEGAALIFSSPPVGIDTDAVVYGANISDGKDAETDEEASAAILERIRNPIKGGTESDYKQWAKEADPSVVSANVIRYPFGLGTVGIVISAGTADIDKAIDNGDAIVVVPSEALIQKVQDYIDTRRPVTDCAHVFSVVEKVIDVTVKVRYQNGDGTTIPAGQSLTQIALVQREVKRAIYKTPAGGRQFGSYGYVVASELEEVIDLGLSAETPVLGEIPILLDRQVQDLSLTGENLRILGNEVPVPGTITVVEVVG